MSVTVDPRLGARRRIVKEDSARRRLRWLLVLMVLAAIGGMIVWFVNSPFMAIERIEVSGSEHSTPQTMLEDLGVIQGEPIIWVRPGRVEDVLRTDPWIKDVRVQLQYPHAVTVTVLERRPLMWTQAGPGWALLSTDGIVLVRASAVPEGEPIAVTGGTAIEPGMAVDDPHLIGALTFIRSLPEPYRVGAQVRLQGDGLWALVGGLEVELGSPTEMTEKAAVVAAIIRQGVGPAQSLDVTAPSRPALVMPAHLEVKALVEGEDPGN